MTERTGVQAQVGSYWDGVSSQATPARTRWWLVPTVVRHVNRRICGAPLEHVGDGLLARTKQTLQAKGVPLPLGRAISVGGGHGHKEMRLVREGLVERVDVYELSESRIERGRSDAAAQGLLEQVQFHLGDAFEIQHRPYDLVHWNNSLHHMLDTAAAVAWSWQVLREGGVFYMDDYVGPNRFQFDARTRRIASEVRAGLEDRLLVNPRHPDTLLPREVRNIDPRRLAEADPSEAPQSAGILDAVQAYFPDADVLRTGGVVYNQALKDALANFDDNDPSDLARLEALLLLDDVATAQLQAQTHYATALAFKGPRAPAWTRARWQARLTATRLVPDRETLQSAFRAAVPSSTARRALGRARRSLFRT